MGYPGEANVNKLLEIVFEKGLGGILRPSQIRREGKARTDAKVDELLRIAQAEDEIARRRSGTHFPLLERISSREPFLLLDSPLQGQSEPSSRVGPAETGQAPHDGEPSHAFTVAAQNIETARTLRREVNVAKAVVEAEDILASDDAAPPEKQPTEDWLFHWAESAGSVSDADMHKLWGKVLAQEFRGPGTWSLRALNFLRTLTREDAELIEKAAMLIIAPTIMYLGHGFEVHSGLALPDLLVLEELQLVAGSSGMLNWKLTPLDGKPGQDLFVGGSNSGLLLSYKEKTTFPIMSITSLGAQIFRLVGHRPGQEMLLKIGRNLVENNSKIDAEIVSVARIGQPDQYRYQILSRMKIASASAR